MYCSLSGGWDRWEINFHLRAKKFKITIPAWSIQSHNISLTNLNESMIVKEKTDSAKAAFLFRYFRAR